MLVDRDGYAIPWPDDDAAIEAGLDDEAYGSAESWPAWTDETRFEPTKEDLADYAAWCLHIERLNDLRREQDAEFEARMNNRFGV
jgi:hypothetical protein